MKTLFFLIAVSFKAWSDEIPNWITYTQREDTNNHYIVCSSESENPEEARKKAELECLSSIFKIKGIPLITSESMNISLEDKIFNGTTTTDKIKGVVGCDFTDQFIEKKESIYRIWLKCRISKQKLNQIDIKIFKNKIDEKFQEKSNALVSIEIGDSLEKIREYAYLYKIDINEKDFLCIKNYSVNYSFKIKNTIFCFNNLSGPLIGKCSYFEQKCQ